MGDAHTGVASAHSVLPSLAGRALAPIAIRECDATLRRAVRLEEFGQRGWRDGDHASLSVAIANVGGSLGVRREQSQASDGQKSKNELRDGRHFVLRLSNSNPLPPWLRDVGFGFR